MTSYRKLFALIHLAQKAMDTHHYTRAEKLLRQLLIESHKSKHTVIFKLAANALLETRRLHILEVLEILKRIDPIQAQRKDLS